MKKCCIFTCLTGNGYDTLNDPIYVDHECDYVCFTDDASIRSDVWTIRQLPIEIQGLSDTRKNRYVKWHPHILLKEYDSTIYIDSNVVPIKKIEINTDKDMCLIKHPIHHGIHEHASRCQYLNKDDTDLLYRQANQYDFTGYVMTYNGIIYRKNTNASKILNEATWNQILQYSSRDQLATPYVVHKNNLYEYIEYAEYSEMTKQFLMLLHSRKSIYNDSNIDIYRNYENKVALCCYVDQSFNIERYVRHYIDLGFDKVILYDTIGIESDSCQIIRYDGSLQDAYDDCMNRFRNEFDYIAFFSHNEWLHLEQDKDIKKFLNRRSFEDAEIITINWKVNDISIYRNIDPYMIKENRFAKPIIHTSAKIDWEHGTTHLPAFIYDDCLLKDADGQLCIFNYDGFLKTYSYDHAYLEYNRGEKKFNNEEIEFYNKIINIM